MLNKKLIDAQLLKNLKDHSELTIDCLDEGGSPRYVDENATYFPSEIQLVSLVEDYTIDSAATDLYAMIMQQVALAKKELGRECEQVYLSVRPVEINKTVKVPAEFGPVVGNLLISVCVSVLALPQNIFVVQE